MLIPITFKIEITKLLREKKYSSAFGQDTIDALFWTATEPRDRKREHIGLIPHLLLALFYVFLHGLLVLLQV